MMNLSPCVYTKQKQQHLPPSVFLNHSASWFKIALISHLRPVCLCYVFVSVYFVLLVTVASVLWRCWLGGWKGIRPVKNFEWWCTGMVICLKRDADLHVAQLMPLPLTVSCFSKIEIGFTFLVPAHLGSPGKRAVKRVCVCVCVVTVCLILSSTSAIDCLVILVCSTWINLVSHLLQRDKMNINFLAWVLILNRCEPWQPRCGLIGSSQLSMFPMQALRCYAPLIRFLILALYIFCLFISYASPLILFPLLFLTYLLL